jgi:UDP-2-acetamido-2,6-beta-L-arabino-hexul-4-ose reductase
MVAKREIMIHIGITGQSGFVGTHLYNYLGLRPGIKRIPFDDSYFQKEEMLDEFVRNCDVIVHLAAMNRHEDEDLLYDTNVHLVKQLIKSFKKTNSTPHILFSSSTQEEMENPYGKSKREGRKLFEEWASNTGARATILIIPNVFGPFGQPFYNSVVATFCHQLIHGQNPVIIEDNDLKLIYVSELLEIFCSEIFSDSEFPVRVLTLPPTQSCKVSSVLNKLAGFQNRYLKGGEFPNLQDTFSLNLFNTFRSFIPYDHFPILFQVNQDHRGAFYELVHSNSSSQFSYSTTHPGIIRGNHFHTRKIERFAVIGGKALIRLRKIGNERILEYEMDGNQPAYVDIPLWHTHHIENVSNETLVTLFWTNEHYNPNDPDTYYEPV